MNEELKVIISAEIGELKQELDKAKQQIGDFSKSVVKSLGGKAKSTFQAIGKEIKALGDNEGFQKLASGCKKGLAVIGASAIAVGATLLSLGESTLDYRNEMSKLNSAFEATGKSTESAKSAYKELYSIIGETDQAVEASQQIALLAKSEQEVAKWAELGAGVVGKFGDALQPEVFYESANETAKLGQATGAYVQMLEGAGVSVEDFNKKLAECSTEAERNQLILSTAEDILGPAGEAYRKTAEDIIKFRESQERLNEVNAKLGEAMTPVNTAFNNFKSQLIEEVTPAVEQFATEGLPELEEKLTNIASAVGNIITFISDNWGFIEPIAGMILAIASAIALLSIGIGIYNGVMAIAGVVSSPVLIALVAISAVIAICIMYWDEIANACKVAWEVIKEIVGEWVTKWESFKTAIADGAENMRQSIENFANNASQKFTEAKNNISNRVNEIKSNAVSKFNEMRSNISTAVSGAYSSVSSIFGSIASTIKSKIEEAKTAVKNGVSALKSALNFSWSLPPLKMPHISISGKFSLNPISVPRFSISWNAQGGVFDKPTLFGYGNTLQGIGEDGAEAVVPLEKNTQWLDRIAERLQGSKTPIVLMVDKKVFGEVAVDSINANTLQTGKLNLQYI